MRLNLKSVISVIVAVMPFTATYAQQDTRTPVTITVDKSHGELTRDGATSTWCNKWESTATNPGATFTSTKNDMQWSGNNIDARSGQAKLETFTVASTSKGYYVSSYSFNYKLVSSSGSETITAGSKTSTVTTTNQLWEVTNTDTSVSPSFDIEGTNSGVLLTDFTITLSPIPGYEEVEEEPMVITTTITDGEFDPQTNWYTIQIAGSGLYLTYSQGATYMALTNTTTEFKDADLWCFTGNDTDGYQIYNKAAGASMKFGAPTTMMGTTGGSSYPIVTTPGRSGYCYDWMFRETDVLGDDTKAYYVNEKGYKSNILNNREGKLAFWTGGTDAGSAIQVIWAQQTIDVTPSKGDFYRFGEVTAQPAWSSMWVSHDNEDFSFKTEKNNMSWSNEVIQLASGMEYGAWTFTAGKDRFVTGYEFDFVRSGSWGTASMTIDLPNEESVEITTAPGHVSVEGLKESDPADFYLTATPANANKLIDVTNFRVTIRRAQQVLESKIVFRYDGTTGYTVCYRIPAITTIENGPNKGRLLAISDYRYSGADIGNGRIDLYMSYSDDNGETWSTPDHMRNASGSPVAQGTGLGTVSTSLQHPDCGFGDAAIVSDRETGRVMVISVCGRTPFFSGRRSNPNQSAQWYSEDGGKTWTNYRTITEKIYSLFDGTVPNGYIDSEFIGSGRMVQSKYIKVGDYYRVYAVLSGYNYAKGNTSNWVLYTDDFGETWNILGDPMTPPVAVNGDEPKAEELPDGSVLLAGRCQAGNRNFNIFRYTDIAKAEGNWATNVVTNMGMGSINACNGEIMIVPVRNIESGAKSYMALQSFPYGGTRRNVSIAWKTLSTPEDIKTPDAFKTWNGRFRVSKMGSAYSTMCWQHDNTLGFFYEEATLGKDYCCVYRNLSIEEITEGQYEYCEDADFAIRKKLTGDLVDFRLENEVENTEPGKYVGQTDGRGNPQAEAAAADFKANPSADNYIAFNNAMVSEPVLNYITIQNGAVYTLRNAHDGQYTFGDSWLTSDGTALTSTATAGDDDCFVFVHQNDSDENWLIYHPSTRTFVGQAPAEMNSAFAVANHHTGSHQYIAESNTFGHTTLTDVDPASANLVSIHLTANNVVTASSTNNQASKWYMSYVRMAEESEMPDLVSSAILTIGAEENAPVKYFDLYGREVKKPAAGQIVVTSDHQKLVIGK